MGVVLTNALLVGVGGFAGSVLRYGANELVHRLAPTAVFPYGTLAVNVIGCFLFGLLAGSAEGRVVLSQGARLFLLVGLLGGFTTFSTFGYETMALVHEAREMTALLNVLTQIVVGLFAVWFGLTLAKTW